MGKQHGMNVNHTAYGSTQVSVRQPALKSRYVRVTLQRKKKRKEKTVLIARA
jgi:hypothetical protein